MYTAPEALQTARLRELQKKNQSLYKKLRESKGGKIDKILDFMCKKFEQDGSNNNNQNDDKQNELAPEIEHALHELGKPNDSDLEILVAKKMPRDLKEEKSFEPITTSNNSLALRQDRESSVTGNSSYLVSDESASNARNDSLSKVHVFIDDLTNNTGIEDADKETITLAFYNDALSKDVIPYFLSLHSTRKSFTEIAGSLVWFINCLNKRNLDEKK